MDLAPITTNKLPGMNGTCLEAREAIEFMGKITRKTWRIRPGEVISDKRYQNREVAAFLGVIISLIRTDFGKESL